MLGVEVVLLADVVGRGATTSSSIISPLDYAVYWMGSEKELLPEISGLSDFLSIGDL